MVRAFGMPLAVMLLGVQCASGANAEVIRGAVDWPREWTVFAPFDGSHWVPDAEVLRSIPDAIRVPETATAPARTIKARKVEVAPGKPFDLSDFAEYAFEELGSEKAVVLRTGWYVEPDGGERFCQFVTRFVFHRDSPVVRVLHTWNDTGDGNRGRIADMSWRFDAAQPVSDGGILTAFDDGEWYSTESLVQFDDQRYLLPADGEERAGRTAGVGERPGCRPHRGTVPVFRGCLAFGGCGHQSDPGFE